MPISESLQDAFRGAFRKVNAPLAHGWMEGVRSGVLFL